MTRNASNPQPPAARRRNPTLRRIRIALVLLIVAYLFAQPWLERQFGWSVPATLDRQSHTPALIDSEKEFGALDAETRVPASTAATGSESEGKLRELRSGLFQSPAGLIYGPGSRHGHRWKHVMAHTKDEPDRAGQHGVFRDQNQDAIVRLIDDAYRAALAGNADSAGSDSERQVWTVDMEREIGYVGGQVGGQQGHPSCRHLRIVLDGKRVITAYPVHSGDRR